MVLDFSDEVSGEWVDVIGDRDFNGGIFADFGIGDRVYGLLCFHNNSFEVGHGEALRPYTQLYIGQNHEEASAIFLKAVHKYQKDVG